MGAEQPFAGRLRLSLAMQGRWDRLDDAELAEGRADLSVSYAPADWVTLSATLPFVLRDARYGNLAHYTTLGPGDADVRARFVLLRDRAFAPENLLGPTLGVQLPTSVDQVANERLVPVDAQSGGGAITPMLGLYYAHFADPWSFFATATVALPFAGRFDEAPGPSLRTTTAVQLRVNRWITLRAGVDTRLDAPATVQGRAEPRSDHFSLFVSPDLLWSPTSDWILQVGLRAPVLQVSEQGREEGWYFRAAVTVDVS